LLRAWKPGAVCAARSIPATVGIVARSASRQGRPLCWLSRTDHRPHLTQGAAMDLNQAMGFFEAHGVLALFLLLFAKRMGIPVPALPSCCWPARAALPTACSR
jgi:hypothetical protein